MAEGKTAQHTVEELRIKVELAKTLAGGSSAYRIGTVLGIAAGIIFCLAGFILAILGVSGQIEWVVEATSLTSRLSNASPGVVFAVAGMIVLWRYKPRAKSAVKIGPDTFDITMPAPEMIEPDTEEEYRG